MIKREQYMRRIRPFIGSELVKFFRSEKCTVATETILNYLRFCADAYLLFQVKRQDLQGKQILATNEKYYILIFRLTSPRNRI